MMKSIILYLPFLVLTMMFLCWWYSYSYLHEEFNHLLLYSLGFLIFLFVSSFLFLQSQMRILLFSSSCSILVIELIIRLGILSQVLSSEKFTPVERFVFNKLPFYGENSVSFDSISGYRWNKNGVTVRKQAMETTVFENTFRGNNYGMHSKREYLPQKRYPNIKRWIVLGDSFTDAYFLRNNWVDVVDGLSRQSADSIELYSFSINGGGIKNWYQIYNQLVQPNFEFDGVVFAVFGNDLNRDYFVMHQQEEKTLQRYYDTVPNRETIQNDIKEIRNDNEIVNAKISRKLYTSSLLNYLYRRYLEMKFYQSLKKSTQELTHNFLAPYEKRIDELYFEKKYGQKFSLMKEMVESLKKSGKSIILISIPEEFGLQINQQGKKTAIQSELMWLCQEYDMKYIDGYKLLLKPNITKPSFIPFDGHWRQAASDSFAVRLYRRHPSFFRNLNN